MTLLQFFAGLALAHSCTNTLHVSKSLHEIRVVGHQELIAAHYTSLKRPQSPVWRTLSDQAERISRGFEHKDSYCITKQAIKLLVFFAEPFFIILVTF